MPIQRYRFVLYLQIYNNVISKLKGGEYTILMHDSSHHINTVSALPYIIKYLKENGYRILPINDQVIPYHHFVNN